MTLLATILFVIYGLGIATYDFFAQLIRNRVLLKLFATLFFFALLNFLSNPAFRYETPFRIVCFIAFAMFHIILGLISGLRIGAGDTKYAMVVSFFLSAILPVQILVPGNLVAIFNSWVIGAIMAWRRWLQLKSQTAIPMAPALFFGALTGVLYSFF